MDRDYYSEKTINQFIRKDVCQNDKLLYKYYQLSNAKKFRRRLQILKVDHKKIEQTVYVFITDSIRDIILQFIGKLAEHMKPMGDLIISGGEAFNTYFSQEDRIVTSDIDTKFVPIMKSGNGRLIGPGYYKYFGYLQAIKLILWDYLGKNCNRIGKLIKKRLQLIKSDKITKILGIRLPLSGPTVTRRYTLIRKQKQSKNNSNNITAGNVLIDVELFALDLNINYYSVEKGKVERQRLGGILDIALMRPFEVGSEVLYSQTDGMFYRNPLNGKTVFNKNIKIAGKKFLIDDLYLMKSLGLRTKKKEKDRKRILRFSQKVLKITNINSSTTDKDLFSKADRKVKSLEAVFDFKDRQTLNTENILKYASKINPYNNLKYVTPPDKLKVMSQFMFGFKGPRNVNVNGFTKTSGPFRFNSNKSKWIKNNKNLYIKNEMNFRIQKKVLKNKQNLSNLSNVILYGYLPSRDRWISSEILRRSSLIPFIGLKK